MRPVLCHLLDGLLTCIIDHPRKPPLGVGQARQRGRHCHVSSGVLRIDVRLSARSNPCTHRQCARLQVIAVSTVARLRWQQVPHGKVEKFVQDAVKF